MKYQIHYLTCLPTATEYQTLHHQIDKRSKWHNVIVNYRHRAAVWSVERVDKCRHLYETIITQRKSTRRLVISCTTVYVVRSPDVGDDSCLAEDPINLVFHRMLQTLDLNCEVKGIRIALGSPGHQNKIYECYVAVITCVCVTYLPSPAFTCLLWPVIDYLWLPVCQHLCFTCSPHTKNLREVKTYLYSAFF